MPVRFLTDQCSITADLACQEFYIYLSTWRPNRSQSSGELSVTNVPMERSLHWHGEMSPAPAACCSWFGQLRGSWLCIIPRVSCVYMHGSRTWQNRPWLCISLSRAPNLMVPFLASWSIEVTPTYASDIDRGILYCLATLQTTLLSNH